MIVGLAGVLLFLFVPETFWDRTPHRPQHTKRPSFLKRISTRHTPQVMSPMIAPVDSGSQTPFSGRERRGDVGFAPATGLGEHETHSPTSGQNNEGSRHRQRNLHVGFPQSTDPEKQAEGERQAGDLPHEPEAAHTVPSSSSPVPQSRNSLSNDQDPRHSTPAHYRSMNGSEANVNHLNTAPALESEKISAAQLRTPPKVKAYTHNLRYKPAKSFVQQLKPYHGRLNNDKWFKVMLRPFILFAYPAVLWSAAVYACSIGWLIVVSESMAMIYRDPKSYNFGALQTGLVYISPFVGGILGTGVAGKISDIIVQAMSRRNGGMYEPEYRLVMAIPILISTCIGLMGFGWAAEEKDHWMVPTAFFGIISFGCSLGSTTSITFCVDSYRQYAGEALVTLNFAKNIFHGLVFSLFVTHWLKKDGPKQVYIWIGIMQLILMLCTIPMYIYGKRARMWTVRMNLMEKF